jgi:hypothetical protein
MPEQLFASHGQSGRVPRRLGNVPGVAPAPDACARASRPGVTRRSGTSPLGVGWGA